MSDRIEAAPDVRELVEAMDAASSYIVGIGGGGRFDASAAIGRGIDALTTLSAKCAEQAEEIASLHEDVERMTRVANAEIASRDEAVARCAEQAAEIERLGKLAAKFQAMAKARLENDSKIISKLNHAAMIEAAAQADKDGVCEANAKLTDLLEQAEADNARFRQREAVLLAALKAVTANWSYTHDHGTNCRFCDQYDGHDPDCEIVKARRALSSIRDGKGEDGHAP